MDKLVAFCWYASDLVYMSDFFLGEAAVFLREREISWLLEDGEAVFFAF